ncbi:hypothetical protein GCM10027282_19660 [Frigoribacterium salinisoli]
MTVDGKPYLLAQGQDLDAVERTATEAVHHGGDLVHVIVHDGSRLDVLVSPGVPLTFETEDVDEQTRDDHLHAPFEVDVLDGDLYDD